ncbi:hypothetical protein E2C01_004739 [Portunus trituberculatus]|uniref:Uncharacterized protein n=1 Tax=Portunus trituberculatus TaxID=210409 RepID=A0A5B7CQT2_PORTR|nr:hypothetical protein [Portunus trituberculatus]
MCLYWGVVVIMKESVLLSKICCGSLFQSLMMHGKNECMYASVLSVISLVCLVVSIASSLVVCDE